MAKYIDYTGSTFGKLTVLKMLPTRNKNSYCLCKCECGNEKIIRTDALLKGKTTSCGCYS